MTQLTTQVAMTECTNYRTLWAQEGFDPSGHVAKVDANGLLMGTVDLYGSQANGVHGSGRAATLNGINLKGCGKTLEGINSDGKPGSKKVFYTHGGLAAREGISEVMALELYNHFFGTPRAFALVAEYGTDNPFGTEPTWSMGGILLRPVPNRLVSFLVEGEWTPDEIRAKLLEDNPEITVGNDVELVKALVKKLAAQYAFLWIRRILVPNVEVGNLSTGMIQYDMPILGVMRDHREVWCCNSYSNRDSLLHACYQLAGLLHRVGLNDGLTLDQFKEAVGELSEMVRAEYRHAVVDAFGLTKEQRDIIQMHDSYNMVTGATLDWLIEAGRTKACHLTFDSEQTFRNEFYDDKMVVDPYGLAIHVFSENTPDLYPQDLVDGWQELLGVLSADERIVAEQTTVKMSATFSDEWRTIVNAGSEGWVAHRHNMPITPATDWTTEVAALMTNIKAAYPRKFNE